MSNYVCMYADASLYTMLNKVFKIFLKTNFEDCHAIYAILIEQKKKKTIERNWFQTILIESKSCDLLDLTPFNVNIHIYGRTSINWITSIQNKKSFNFKNFKLKNQNLIELLAKMLSMHFSLWNIQVKSSNSRSPAIYIFAL